MDSRYEQYEADISALIDGELEPERTVELMDRIATDERLRQFYRDVRHLQSLVDAAPPKRESAPPPEDLWNRIEKETKPKQAMVIRLNSTLVKTLAAAAVVLITIGALAGGLLPGQDKNWREDVIEVDLASQENSMTEQRFIELTTELLRADRRYHRKMYDVMEMVTRQSVIPEGSYEGESIEPDHSVDMAVNSDEEGPSERSMREQPLEITFW
ncbi:hypothetical protein GF324_11465 [bacterium]|nr:hypothetical protein [bacterium]